MPTYGKNFAGKHFIPLENIANSAPTLGFRKYEQFSCQ